MFDGEEAKHLVYFFANIEKLFEFKQCDKAQRTSTITEQFSSS